MLSLLTTAIISQAQWVARHNLSAADYQAAFNQFTQQGLRPVCISGYSVGGQDRFAAIWRKVSNSPAWEARHGLDANQYQTYFTDAVSRGFRPVQVSCYPSGNTVRYACIFEKQTSSPAWVSRHGLNATQYQEEFNKWTGQGYMPVDLGACTFNGQSVHTLIFEKRSNAPAWVARHGLNGSQYQQEFNKWTSQGYRLKKVVVYALNNQPAYAAIWEKSGSAAWQSNHGMNNRGYQDQFDRMFYSGYYPVWVSGGTVANSDVYAATWETQGAFNPNELAQVDQLVNKFMADNKVPGLSFAIAKDGRLVLAKTYGMADKEGGEAVAPRHRFRIASLSKPITATAIMKLREQNKVQFGDKVFGNGSIFGTSYGTQPYKPWITDITVDHLLSHLSGGWQNDGSDPMFQDGSLNFTQLINQTINNQALTDQPGTKSKYSNFGYCLLGRIIEKKTNTNYESWVKSNILAPCGISNMEIGGNTLAARKTNEVKYYGQNNEDPYCCNVNRMDAHGGWIATPIDLCRFLVKVDRFSQKSDILNAGSLASMYTAAAVSPGYARGWSVNAADNYWHGGSLPGLSSIMVRTSGGYCWALTMNTRGSSGDIDGLVWQIIAKISQWPSFDLF